jgi:acid phosphatase
MRRIVLVGLPMSLRISLLALAVITFFYSGDVAFAAPCNEITIPADPRFNIQKGLDFSETEEYTRQFQNAVDAAKKACELHISVPNRAIVFDIDETVLDNRELIKKIELPSNPVYLKTWHDEEWTRWVNQAEAPALKPSAELLRWARTNGFALFAITARDSEERVVTEMDLKKHDIPYDAIYLKPHGSTQSSEDFKTSHRAMIEAQGYVIVCNIGDQESDLYGLHSLDCEKLPNRMYFTK